MLTALRIHSTQAGTKCRKLFDHAGLYLLVQPSGSRLWRFRYRFGGVEKLISLGSYPEVSLGLARRKRDDARRLVAANIDPSAQRRVQQGASRNTFESVAREFLSQQARKLGAVTIKDTAWRLTTFLVPEIGSVPIDQIEAPELLAALRKMEARGLTDSVHRTKQFAGRVFRYGIATGRCKRNVAADLQGAIALVPARHHAAVTDPKEVGLLLRAIDNYRGQPATCYALRLLPLVFLRSSELRGAQWPEIDFETAVWRVPASRMKMQEAHLVPLAAQAVALLRDLQGGTGIGQYLFQSLIPGKPISENTLNQALMRLGYSSEQQTPHGFRTIASTLLNEQGWAPDLIELQLAHRERNKVRAAYNRAQRLPERRKLMQDWADYLDALKQGGAAKVVNLHAARSA